MMESDGVRLARVWSQAFGFVLVASGRILASVSVKMYSHLIYFKYEFYNLYTSG
jgi:hypothetical protein